MSKQNEIAILVPGATGWEIWSQGQDGSCARMAEAGPLQAGELEGLPAGELAMLFPVRSFHALPFRAASTDESLFEDLATMHAERLGIRTDPMGGQLCDTFEVAGDGESTVLLHVALKSPGEGELPPRTPTEFDLSPRAFPVESDAVAAWKELGRWVFAIYSQGKLIYCQATSSSGEAPDPALLREIHLALGQLSIQGLRVVPKAVHVWPQGGELGEAGSLADGLGVPATVSRRPDPGFPDPPSRLLPADVRAARRRRQQRNQRVGMAAAAALVVLGFAGWAGFDLFKDIRKRNELAEEAKTVEGVALEKQLHDQKWKELGPVVDSKRSPLELMLAIQSAIPRGGGLRLSSADIKAGGMTGGTGENSYVAAEIKLSGAAMQSAPVNSFSLALKRRADLNWLDWQNSAPNNTTKGWEFSFDASEADELP